MINKDLIIFDLDGTLAPSKSSIEPDMLALLMNLLAVKKVTVISGGMFNQFENQILKSLPATNVNFKNLILMPASGSMMYTWKDGWMVEYAKKFTPAEKEKITNALEAALDEAHVETPDIIYGPPIIQDRETQITFSDFGQEAPLDVKLHWDPDHAKRERIVKFLKERIPEFSINIGGATSIDITHHGIDKAYAIRKLSDRFGIPIERMLFVGDALFPGGNDYPAVSTGIECKQISGPEETKALIQSWLN